MASSIYTVVIVSVLLLYLTNVSFTLWRNVALARASGIPYVIVPLYPYNQIQLLLTRPFMRLLDKLYPNPPSTSWRRLGTSGWLWSCRYATFAALETDNFLTVSPGGIILYTADANVIAQITNRGNDFPKATFIYNNVNIYGKNIVSTEGLEWRRYRRMTSPAFGERNNQLVWSATLEQCQDMLTSWLRTSRSGAVSTAAEDTMRLSLAVISRAGLDQVMTWHELTKPDSVTSDLAAAGHAMTFANSLQYLLSNVLYVMAFPQWFLRRSPFKRHRKVLLAYRELGAYMHELVEKRRSFIATPAAASNSVDLLTQLLKEQTTTPSADGHFEISHSSPPAKLPSGRGSSAIPCPVDNSHIIGNLFVFYIAGHETSANSIHFSLMLLALHPSVQRAVHRDLDAILADRSPSQWRYDVDLPRLLTSTLGAVLAEELRLISPVMSIPKVVGASPQSLNIAGRIVTVPPHTVVRLALHAVHRNPRFWPHSALAVEGKSACAPTSEDNDLEEFKPGRWCPSVPNTGDAALFSPPRGAYLPFSEGQRACIGRRFAQVEIMAALAVILASHSVELAVDEWASDAEVEGMGATERRRLWETARDKADATWQQRMVCIITLQIRGAKVPLRFVERGQERFADVVTG